MQEMQETWVWSLSQEDPLEEEMATWSSILAWKILWTEEPGRLQSMRLQRVGHDWVTNTQRIDTQGSFHYWISPGNRQTNHLPSVLFPPGPRSLQPASLRGVDGTQGPEFHTNGSALQTELCVCLPWNRWLFKLIICSDTKLTLKRWL